MQTKQMYLSLAVLCCFLSFNLSSSFAQGGADADWGEPQLDEKQAEIVKKGKKYIEGYSKAYKAKHGTNPVFKLAGAELAGLDLSGCNLAGADLREADLRGIKLVGANLQGANLRGADIGEYKMNVADMTDANMEGVNLHAADMTGAKFVRANLCGADLSQSSFIGTNISKANMAGANVEETDFEQCTASHTIMINVDQDIADNIVDAAVWEKIVTNQKELDQMKFKFIHVNSSQEKIDEFLEKHKSCVCTWENDDE
ncbi:MAG: pentapeptide repeat-containing protein [Saprospiraceae bacterium]|nr:pentapeptide repeat-containing protein [Saprospiraceae bacterium]